MSQVSAFSSQPSDFKFAFPATPSSFPGNDKALPRGCSASPPVSAFQFSTSAFPVVANIGTGQPQTIRQFAEHWWKEWGATGKLLPGALPYRDNEVMRYVPEVSPLFESHD
jgi:hypothetical protein